MPPRPVAKARADAAQRAQLTAGRLIDVSDADTDATLARVSGCLHLDAIADLAVLWMRIARQEPKVLDGLAKLSRCVLLEWQGATGADWAERLTGGNPSTPTTRTRTSRCGRTRTRCRPARRGPAR